MHYPKIDVIIVNWNAGIDLIHCIKSVKLVSDVLNGSLRIILVDNASVDNSVAKVSSDFPEVKIIMNSSNRGFAAACNQGAAVSDAGYILFLNPDTQVSRKSFEIPLKFMMDPGNWNYAVCGIQMRSGEDKVSRSSARFPELKDFFSDITGISKLFPNRKIGLHMTDWDHSVNRDVDHVIGAFYLIRRHAFETVGGFDERFYVYLEDLDLSKRIYDNGWKIRYLAEANCYHKGGGTSESVKATRLFYFLRSKILYGFKHLKPVSAFILLTATLVVEPLTRLVFSHTSPAGMVNVCKAFLRLYKGLPGILKTARQ